MDDQYWGIPVHGEAFGAFSTSVAPRTHRPVISVEGFLSSKRSQAFFEGAPFPGHGAATAAARFLAGTAAIVVAVIFRNFGVWQCAA